MEFAGDNPAIAVLAASLLAFYSFVGFETSANLAEEVKDVRRTYPRALFLSLITAGVVYVAVGLASTAAVDPGRLADSTGPLLEVVNEADVVPERVFAVIALIAVANGALSCVLLLTQQEASTWLRAGILLGVGAVLHLVTRRSSQAGPELADVVEDGEGGDSPRVPGMIDR